MTTASSRALHEEEDVRRAAARTAVVARELTALRTMLEIASWDGPAMQIVCDALDSSALADLGALPWTIETLGALVDEARAKGAATALCRSLLSLGHACSYANRFDDALAALAELVAVAEAAGERLLAARGRVALIHPLSRRGRWDEALAEGLRGRDAIAELAANDASLGLLAAKADANLGVLQKTRHEPARALEHFDRCIAAFAAQPPARAQLESNRGEVLLELGRFEEAEAAFRSALVTLESLGLERAAAIVEGNLADLAGRLGRLGDATTRYERARRGHERAGAVGDVARLRAEQAELFAAAGLLVEARLELEGALDGLVAAGLVTERARAARALARVHLRRGEPRAALRVIEAHRAASESQAAGLDDGARAIERGRWLLAEGSVQLALGQVGAARVALAESVERLAGQRIERCVALAEAAAACARDGDREAARRWIDEAIHRARDLDLAPLETECLRIRIGLEPGTPMAIEDGRRGIALVERTRGSLQADRLRSAFAAQTWSIHETHAASLLASERLSAEELFDAVEGGRNRSLLDRIDGGMDEGAGPAEDALDAESRALRERLNLQWSRADRSESGGDAQVWREETRGIEERLRVAEARAAAGIERGSVASTRSLASVRAALPPSTALVQWIVASGRIAAIVIRGDSTTCVALGTHPDALADATEAARFQIARRIMAGENSRFAERFLSDAIRALRRLHQMLLEPLGSALDGATDIRHVPSGALLGVPFQALHDGSRFAIERTTVGFAPSASGLVALGERVVRDGRRLIIGVADARAPAIDEEVDRIAEAWPDALVLRGPAATREAVMAAASEASTIHIAAHGRFPAGSPRSAGLRLADGWWTARDIERANLRGTRLVVAACESGRLVRLGGDESGGLVRAFLAAGAAELVVSEWAASDRHTRRMMAGVAERVRAGASLATALTRSMRDEIERDEHPALWAPFMIYGPARGAVANSVIEHERKVL
jgi:CHAT domain-containing protein